jgi:HTH-type transcriptional regulator/antitoxin HigA
MNLQRLEDSLTCIVNEASFILKIKNKEEHEKALALIEQLIEDYDKHEALIELLSTSIEKYENEAEEFVEFNQRLSELNSGVAALSVLMDQHKLNTTDFRNEIGGKSLVSMILNGKRALNIGHIRRLAERFNVPVQVFV